MFLTLIISFIFLLFLLLLMNVGYIFNNTKLKGTCGSTDDNPCTCTLLEKINCQKKNINQQ